MQDDDGAQVLGQGGEGPPDVLGPDELFLGVDGCAGRALGVEFRDDVGPGGRRPSPRMAGVDDDAI